MNFQCNEKNISFCVTKADTFLRRLCGLMFRKCLPGGEGLLLMNCRSIHMCFMRFPICAVYLDDRMTVLSREVLRPWRIGTFVKGARHVLEVNASEGIRLCAGDRFRLS